MMKIFRSIESMPTSAILDLIGKGANFIFSVGFIAGFSLAIVVFVLNTSELIKNIGVPVVAMLLLLALLGFNRYLYRTILPEIKKRCHSKSST